MPEKCKESPGCHGHPSHRCSCLGKSGDKRNRNVLYQGGDRYFGVSGIHPHTKIGCNPVLKTLAPRTIRSA